MSTIRLSGGTVWICRRTLPQEISASATTWRLLNLSHVAPIKGHKLFPEKCGDETVGSKPKDAKLVWCGHCRHFETEISRGVQDDR